MLKVSEQNVCKESLGWEIVCEQTFRFLPFDQKLLFCLFAFLPAYVCTDSISLAMSFKNIKYRNTNM